MISIGRTSRRFLHMLRHIVALITLLATSLALTTSAPADLTPAASRKPLPEVALSDSNGASVDLSAYKGRVVLLDFWATWCEGCKEEIPWFMEDRKSTRLNSSHPSISYAVFCLKKKTIT